MYESQSKICRNWFSSYHVSSGDWTQACGKDHGPLNPLTGPGRTNIVRVAIKIATKVICRINTSLIKISKTSFLKQEKKNCPKIHMEVQKTPGKLKKIK